jgi:ADP-heptose:LPS heptosyltransferase/glycosyltransferase involved in cell wall biosynthesis
MDKIIRVNDLKVGQRVKVKGKLGKDGAFVALEISMKPLEDHAEIEGLIRSIDFQKNTLRLLNREFVLPDGIAIKDLQGNIIGLKDLRAGDMVKLKGKYSEPQGFVLEKIKMQEITSFDLEELQGDIRNIDQERRALDVIGFTVVVNEKTKIRQSPFNPKRIHVTNEYDNSSHDLTKIDTESEFARQILELFHKIRPKKIIETGTYLGTGTTTIIASCLRQLRIEDSKFYTIEVNPKYYRKALGNLAKIGFLSHVTPLNGLSIQRKMLLTLQEIENRCVKNIEFNDIFIDHKEYERALLYCRETSFDDVPNDLLGDCLRKFDYRPDFVLLDSAGHIGNIEFNYLISQLKGECYIALDDIYHIKHHKSFLQIKIDPRFELIVSSKEKFGFCIARFTPREEAVEIAVKSILWIRTDSIGDNVLAASMLPHIRRKYKDARITVVCQEHITELYEACPFVDDIISYERERAQKDKEYRKSIIQWLRALNADLVLNSVYSREPLADKFAIKGGAKERLAFNGNLCNISAEVRDRNNQLYTRLLPSDGEHKPELERHRDFLKGLGIDVPPLQPIIWTTPEDERFADEFFRVNDLQSELTIALFAGAQSDKRIYREYGIALLQICKDNQFVGIALGATLDHGINQYNLDTVGVRAINLCGRTTLRQTAAILKRCRLAVGAETGLAHVACAVGTPNVILLGGGHFGRFMPYSPLTSVVCLPLECYGCGWICKYRTPHCISDIVPEVIAEAVRQTLEQCSEKPRVFVQDRSLWNPQAGQPQWQSFDKFLDVSTVEIIPVGEILQSKYEPIEASGKNELEYLVSAIVSTYDADRFIRGCLEDLEAQTIADRLEIIVVDSGSQQNEGAIVKEFQQRYDNIVYIRTEERESVYAAWNRGIRVAHGKYVTNANTADRHKRDAIERMVAVLEARPDIALVYANVYITKTENETFEKHTGESAYRWPDFDPLKLIDHCFIGPQPLWRRSMHAKYGYFNESFGVAGNWEFWLRIAAKEAFLHLDEFLGLYFESSTSVEQQRHDYNLFKQENLRVRQRYLHRVVHPKAAQLTGFNDLKAGQSLKVKGKLGEDGVFEALKIRMKAPADEAEIEGLVQSVDHQKNTLRLFNRNFALPDDIAVKDSQHNITALKDLKVGNRVQLKGKYSESKGFVPEKIKVQETTSLGIAELQGNINKIGQEKKTFEVVGFTVVVNEDTIIY